MDSAAQSKEGEGQLHVQVCYAAKKTVFVVEVALALGANIRDAIIASQIAITCNEIDIHQCKVGVFGKMKSMDAPLKHGDRVEIYRPLIADPMEARRRRASLRLNQL
jgi:putative ubiquitin-RnfH superfamily antitoxin RatB of RatAB toxin-antitoxin module